MAVVVGACPGCSFQARATCEGACPQADARVDADGAPADGAPADAPPDGAPDGPPALAFCDAAGGDLIACFEFEGSGADGSPNDLDATLTAVTFVTGQVGMAAHIEGTATITLAESALLAPTALTLEAWIRPAQLPATGARMGIADNEGQWGLFLQPAGALQGVGLTAQAAIAPGVWTHVALTYDGTTRMYAAGVEVGASAGGGAPLPASGTQGTSLAGNNPSGSPLLGEIDQVRLFRVARTPAQICAAAGLAVCP